MGKSSLGKRKNSALPVRLSSLNEPDKLPGPGNSQRGQSVTKRSHIPKPSTATKGRSSSSEREERHGAQLVRSTSIPSLQSLGLATPITPIYLQTGTAPGTAQSVKSCLLLGDIDSRTHSTKKMVRDLRPLSDRHFQNMALEKIQSYFQQQTASSSVTSNSTDLLNALKSRSLTLKFFVEMVSHLFSFFYKNHVINMTNYADEIPLLAKKIGYPNSVKKSWLITANSSHSWPNVVGLLSWLVDTVQCITPEMPGELMFPPQEEELDFEQDPIIRILGNKRMCDYYLKCYSIFNKGDENADEDRAFETSQLKQEMINTLDINYNEHEILQEEIVRLEEKLNDSAEIEAQNEIEKLQSALTSLKNDEKKLQACFRKRKAYSYELHEESKNLSAEQDAVKSSIKELQAEIERAERMLDNQTLSLDDKKRIEEECREINEKIKMNQAYYDSLSKAIYTEDLKIAKLKNVSNELCMQYNARFMEHASIPAYDDFLVKVNILHADTSCVLQDIDSRLDRYIMEVKSEMSEMESKIEEEDAHNMDSNERKKMAAEEYEKLCLQIDGLKNEIGNLKEEMKKDDHDHARYIAVLQENTGSLSLNVPSISELKKELEAAQKRNILIQKEAKYVQEMAENTIKDLEDMFQGVVDGAMAKIKNLADLSRTKKLNK